MKSWALVFIVLSIVVIGVLGVSLSDKSSDDELAVADIEKQMLSKDSAAKIAKPNEHISTSNIPNIEVQLDEEPRVQSALLRSENQSATEEQTIQELIELLEKSEEELHFEEGLSEYNLMILKDLAIRFNDFNAQPDFSNLEGSDWPAEMLDALDRLSKAFEAESSFQQVWLEADNSNPEDYRKDFLKQQQEILGKALYERVYAEDLMLVDDSGLSANYPSEETPSLKTEDHKQRLNVLEQWRQDKLSEAELKTALSDSLSSDEINQLIDTGLHEAQWLEKLDAFLDEYRYIEQSGIIGEDELNMRKELIQKHFTEEDRLIVHQFLFSAQSQE